MESRKTPSTLLVKTSTGATVYIPSSVKEEIASQPTALTAPAPQTIELNHKPCNISAVTGSVSSSHVVTIQISEKKRNRIADDHHQSSTVNVKVSPVLSSTTTTVNNNNNINCLKSNNNNNFIDVETKREYAPNVSIVSLIKPDHGRLLDLQTLTVTSSSGTTTLNGDNHPNCSININTNNKHNLLDSCSSGEFVAQPDEEMVQKTNGDLDVNSSTYLYYMMPSGQCSPSDTLDSGTCSDLENSPPPLPKKMSPKGNKVQQQQSSNSIGGSSTPQQSPSHSPSTVGSAGKKVATSTTGSSTVPKVVNGVGHHKRSNSSLCTDSAEESESSLSCDSLNSSELNGIVVNSPIPPTPPLLSTSLIKNTQLLKPNVTFLPDSLLRDIRDHSLKFTTSQLNHNHINYNHYTHHHLNHNIIVNDNDFQTTKVINNYNHSTVKLNKSKDLQSTTASKLVQQQNQTQSLKHTGGKTNNAKLSYENDIYYKFHINENVPDMAEVAVPKLLDDDESFAGYKDIHSGTSTIRSSKGTVRGVKNRVRNGIATFLQMQNTNTKNYKEKDAGKVVLYSTSMGIIRQTYAKCANIKQILRTLLVKFEERDVFMSTECQQEIKDRMQSNEIKVPQLFVDGQHIGDADFVEKLNESGELRQMLKPYKSSNPTVTCQMCGGYRLLPCTSCNGSKKSVHRNHFTTEFVALKCMNCDEVGLVKCHNC